MLGSQFYSDSNYFFLLLQADFSSAHGLPVFLQLSIALFCAAALLFPIAEYNSFDPSIVLTKPMQPKFDESNELVDSEQPPKNLWLHLFKASSDASCLVARALICQTPPPHASATA